MLVILSICLAICLLTPPKAESQPLTADLEKIAGLSAGGNLQLDLAIQRLNLKLAPQRRRGPRNLSRGPQPIARGRVLFRIGRTDLPADHDRSIGTRARRRARVPGLAALLR